MKNNNFKMLALGLMGAGSLFTYKMWQRNQRRQDLKGQVIIITGASSGIGKEYAYTFAREGANIVLAARSTEKIEQLAQEIKDKYNVEAIAVTTDVSIEDQSRTLIEKALDKFNKVDILINNAGIASYGYFHDNDPEHLKQMMDVNYWGMVYCTHAVLPSMIKRGKGTIINVSSFAAKRGMPVMAIYSSTKAAMNTFSQGLRAELKSFGVDVLVVCPTSTKTEIVRNALDTKAIAFGEDVGMSAQRVAEETLTAYLDKKSEHVIGLGENILVAVDKVVPDLIDQVLSHAPKFMLKKL